MTDRVRVGAEEDLGDGDRKTIDVDGQSIGVLNVDGRYYAILNKCLHRDGPLCNGKVGGKIMAEHTQSGKRVKEWVGDAPSISCPWHGWEYDLETGEHIGDSSKVVPTYEVTVEDGTVYVEV